MGKWLLSSTALACALAVPAAAAAQPAPSDGGGSCAPGSWFCGRSGQPTTSGSSSQTLQPLPDPDEAAPSSDAPPPPPPPPVTRRRPPRPSAPPPVVVYQPPAPSVLMRPDEPPPYEYAHPVHRGPNWPAHEWGLNVHFEGALIGNGTQGNASMGGVGGGLRFKPIRSFGLEADLDFAGGDHDYQGDKRSETAFMLNGLFFLNPRSHAQIYLLAGFGWSGAHVTCDSCSTPLDRNYDYFGGQVGAGLELRLGRVVAFNADIRGFIRGRTDSLAQSQPEFDSPAGCSTNPSFTGQCRTTNTSGGGLLTAGMTRYV
jgi:opacity protein-like surface antigen